MKQKITCCKVPEIVFIISLLLACEFTDPPIYSPPVSPLKLGHYLVTDSHDSYITEYKMSVTWLGGKDQVLELCHFNGGRMSIVANVLEGNSLRIPAQTLGDELHYLEILQGSGKFTHESFEITYWARDLAGVDISGKIKAELIN